MNQYITAVNGEDVVHKAHTELAHIILKNPYYIALDVLDHNPLQQINEAGQWKHWTITQVLYRQPMGQVWPAMQQVLFGPLPT